MERITGVRPGLPARLSRLMSDPERTTLLPNDLSAVERFVEANARAVRGAAA
jgi:threonine synthase